MEREQVFSSQRTVPVGRVEAQVAEAGKGRPVLLLHGNPDTHTVWSDVVLRLGSGVRCIAPDLPGFGGSRAPADFDCSLESQAAFVADLLDALALDKVDLVVHDVGGTYGLAFATVHPGRIRSLTILNTTFFPDYRWHFWGRVWRTRLLGELAMAIANRPLFVHELRRGSAALPVDYARHAYQRFARSTKRMVLRWYRAMDPKVHEGWDRRLLEAIADLPVQVLWGDRDVYLPASTADRFGGQVHHFPEHGHWLMVEAPEKVATHISSLLDATA